MIIIDYRNICKIASFSTLSGTIACCWPTEPEEIAARIVKRIYCLTLDYPNEFVVIANDKPPYWRSSYIDQWYSDRGLEPVRYKANRLTAPWPFKTSPDQMNEIYALLLKEIATAFGASVIEDEGLEADDVFAILVKGTEPVPDKAAFVPNIIAVSMDSDWRQLASERVTVLDPATNQKYNTPDDIRPKLIAGDRGDNIMGCPKTGKGGKPAKNNWGIDGAKKLVASKPDTWHEGLDADILERNHNLICLPCPLWDVAAAHDSIKNVAKLYDKGSTTTILDKYGITEPVRKQLTNIAERDKFIMALRARLQENVPAPQKEEV